MPLPGCAVSQNFASNGQGGTAGRNGKGGAWAAAWAGRSPTTDESQLFVTTSLSSPAAALRASSESVDGAERTGPVRLTQRQAGRRVHIGTRNMNRGQGLQMTAHSRCRPRPARRAALAALVRSGLLPLARKNKAASTALPPPPFPRSRCYLCKQSPGRVDGLSRRLRAGRNRMRRKEGQHEHASLSDGPFPAATGTACAATRRQPAPRIPPETQATPPAPAQKFRVADSRFRIGAGGQEGCRSRG